MKSQATPAAAPLPVAEANRLLHELQVHQIELEMQNEKLVQSRQELEAALAHYTELYDFAPVGYLSVDRAGQITQSNLAAEGLLGTERARLQGRRLAALIAQADQGRFNAWMLSLFTGESSQSCEVALHSERQPVRIVRMVATRAESGAERRLALEDITVNRKSADDQQAGAAKFARLIESVDGIVWEADAATLHFTYVSARAERLLGYPLARWTTEPTFWADHIHPDDRDQAVRYCVTCTKKKQDHEFEYRMLAADGSAVWLRDIVTVEVEGARAKSLGGVMVDITQRKAAEAALRDSEQKFRSIVDAEPECVKLLGENCELLEMNPAGLQMIAARSMAQVRGLNTLELIEPTYRALFTAGVAAVFRGETTNQIFEIIALDGQRHWMEQRAVPLWEERPTRRVKQMLAVTRDITERKQAEAALRESEGRWRFALEGAGDGLWDWNMADDTAFFSKRFKSMIGYGENEMDSTKEAWASKVHPEDLTRVMAALQPHLEGKATGFTNEHRLRCKDGSYKWILTRGLVILRDAAGRPLRMVGTHSDITARKAAEAAARERERQLFESRSAVSHLEQRLELAVKGAGFGVWEFDLNSGRLIWDGAMHELYGYAVGEFDGSPDNWRSLLHPDDRELVKGRFDDLLIGKGVQLFTFRAFRRSDGAMRQIEANGMAEMEAGGRVRRLVGMNRDVTDRMQAHDQLRLLEASVAQIIEAVMITEANFESQAGPTIVFANPAMERLSGYTRAELIGKTPRLFQGPKTDRAALDRIREGLRQRKTTQVELINYNKAGEEYWVELSLTPVVTAAGVVTHFVSIETDITARRAAAAALQASVDRLDYLVSSSPAVIYTSRASGDYGATFISRNLERQLGHTPEDFLADPSFWLSHLHPDDAPNVLRGLAELFRHGSHVQEYRFRLKDGTYRWMRDENRLIRDAAGAPLEILGYWVDITERKESEIALQASAEQYRALFDSSPVPLALNDAAQNVVRLNAAFEKTFGYTQADIPTLADWWLKAYPDPEYRRLTAEAWQERLARAARDGTNFEDLEVTVRCRDGTSRIVVASAADLGTAMAGLHLVALYDITPRKTAEQALQASRQQLELEHGRLQQALEIAELVWWEWNLKTGRVRVDTGDVGRCIMGFQPGGLPAASHEEWLANVAAEDRTGVEAELQRVIRGETQECSIEYRGRFADGDYRWVRLFGRVTQRDEAGMAHVMTGTLQNIHAAQLEAARKSELELMLRESRKMGMLGQFAAGVAHDFNNLLTGIGGNIQMALGELAPGASAVPSLQIARRACDRSRDLVLRLMQFARGEQNTKRAPTNMERLVRETAPLIIAVIPRRVSLNLALKACPSIMADEGQIMQVLMNLSLNGAHACAPTGGVVTLSLEPVVNPAQPGGAVQITVTDNGSGMDEATLARIFEAFFTTKPAGQGTGLGMGVVREIVEAHDGQISVESKPGVGTTVRIILPIETAAVPTRPPNAVTGRIVVVDDDEMILELMTATLTKAGHTVSGYTGAESALASMRASHTPVDLLVTDLTMPGGSGIDLIQAMRVLQPGLPAVIMSGDFGREKARLAALPGVTKLAKPLELRELNEAVVRLLAAR